MLKALPKHPEHKRGKCQDKTNNSTNYSKLYRATRDILRYLHDINMNSMGWDDVISIKIG